MAATWIASKRLFCSAGSSGSMRGENTARARIRHKSASGIATAPSVRW